MIVMNRRELVRLLSCGAASLSALDPLFTLAQSNDSQNGKILIILNLEGGMDHLSAFPYLNDPSAPSGQGGFVAELQVRRPNILRVPASNLMANSYLGFHSGWAPIYPEFSNNHLALMQSIGITPGQHPGGSHNFCQNIYSFANQDFQATSKAWIADFIDRNSLTRTYGFGTGGRVDFNTSRKELAPIVGSRAEALTYSDPLGSGRQAVNFDFSRRFAAAAGTPATAQVEKVMQALDRSSATMEFMSGVVQTPIAGVYPANSTGDTFKSIARTIKKLELDGDRRPRLFYAFQGGFDTHGNQSPNLDSNITSVGSALGGLVADLKAINAYDRTAIIAISEFSRTAWENGGAGTDHGWGTTLFALGGAIVGGVRGEPPQLSYMLERNECRALVDFRNVIKESLDWMGLTVRGDDVIAPNLYTRVNLGLFAA